MPPSEHDKERVELFRAYIEDATASDDRYGPVSRDDREDGSLLASRFAPAPNYWFEVAIRPFIPQVRVGFLTDDRWKSEEAEQFIEDSGDSMSEFVGMGMEEAGLDLPEPTVEHFREAGKYYYFSTPLTIDSLAELDREEFRNKVLRMLEGYMVAFGPAIVVEEAEENE